MAPEIPPGEPSIEAPLSGQRLDELAEAVAASIVDEPRTRHLTTAYLPSRRELIGAIDRLSWLLFPGFIGPRALDEETLEDHVRSVLAAIAGPLFHQVAGALRYGMEAGTAPPFDEHCPTCDEQARKVVNEILGQVPVLRGVLAEDVQAAFDGDPAARHTDDAVFCYPGFRALWMHRVAHEFYRRQVPLVGRIIAEHAHGETGIDIHPGATIGRAFFIDHGTGVVIGETTVIGDHCKIYQGVTLGARSFEKDERGEFKRGTRRHPTLGDRVTVYAGATILGGDVVIGDDCIVAGGVFLTRSVEAGHIVRGPRADVTLIGNPDIKEALS